MGFNFFKTILDPVIQPLEDIGEGIYKVMEFIVKIMSILPDFIKSIFEIFTPNKFLNDLVYGTFASFGYFLMLFLVLFHQIICIIK